MDSQTNTARLSVVEDEPQTAVVCMKTLVNDGHEVEVASNDLITMEMDNNKTCDLYFSDMRTPAENGMEFHGLLNQKNPRLSRRIIVTTVDVMSSDVGESMELYWRIT